LGDSDSLFAGFPAVDDNTPSAASTAWVLATLRRYLASSDEAAQCEVETLSPMTASGYLLGDYVTLPAGYVVDKILVSNTGTDDAEVLLQSGDSSGAYIAVAQAVAGAGWQRVSVSLPLACYTSGCKVYVAINTDGIAAVSLKVKLVKMSSPMSVETLLPMTASGYLLGDYVTWPAGYVIDKILLRNSGTAGTDDAEVLLQSGDSSGAYIAVAQAVAGAGWGKAPLSLPLEFYSSGGAIFVAINTLDGAAPQVDIKIRFVRI
jgi:hypothetical protein